MPYPLILKMMGVLKDHQELIIKISIISNPQSIRIQHQHSLLMSNQLCIHQNQLMKQVLTILVEGAWQALPHPSELVFMRLTVLLVEGTLPLSNWPDIVSLELR